MTRRGKAPHTAKRSVKGGGGARRAAGSSSAAASSGSSSHAASAARPPASGKQGSSRSSEGRTVEQLLAEAESLTEEMQLDRAVELYETALERSPDDVRCIDALAELAFQRGDVETALAMFTRSVELAPEGHYSRHLYLGQLLQGEDAAAAFMRGIKAIDQRLAALRDSGTASSSSSSSASSAAAAMEGASDTETLTLRRDLCKVCCSMVELFMTDLCENDGAEKECETYASRAVAEDGDSPEACRVMADLRLCQQRNEESRPYILRAVELLERCYPREEGDDEEARAELELGARATQPSSSSSSSSEVAGGVDAPPPADATATLPPYSSRLRVAQIAMELELYDAAATVLDRLLCEDDSDMEVWYLLGEACLHSGELEEAAETLQAADEMLSSAIERVKRMGGKPGAHRLAQQQATDDALMRFDKSDLLAQRAQIRKLLEVVRQRQRQGVGAAPAASAAAAPRGSASAATGGDGEDEDGDEALFG